MKKCQTRTNSERQTPIGKMAKVISSKLKGFDQKSPVQQLSVYMDVGRHLNYMQVNEQIYGIQSMVDIGKCVPHLSDVSFCYAIVYLSLLDDCSFRDFLSLSC